MKKSLVISLTLGVLALVGCGNNQEQQAAVLGAPTQLRMSGLSMISAGSCIQYVIVSLDENFDVAEVSSNTTVQLSNTSTGTFYSDSGCAYDITSTTILANNAFRAVYYKNTVAESHTLSATATGLDAGEILIESRPGYQSRVDFSGPATASTYACVTFDLTAKDYFGNVTTVVSDLNVDLSNDKTAKFYSDSACTMEITSTEISESTSNARVYVKHTDEEMVELKSSPEYMDESVFYVTFSN